MFTMKKLALGALLGMTTVVALPESASAHSRYDRHGYHDRDDRYRGHREYRREYYQESRRYDRDRRHYRQKQRCRTSGTTGLIVGGAAGALLGRSIDRYGDRAPGTILGAAGGALLGREIDRKRRC